MKMVLSWFFLTVLGSTAVAKPTLTVYENSLRKCAASQSKKDCLPELAATQRCITVGLNFEEEKYSTCKVSAAASLVEAETGFTREVIDTQTLTLNKKSPQNVELCFNFAKDLHDLWKFSKFSGFTASCLGKARPGDSPENDGKKPNAPENDEKLETKNPAIEEMSVDAAIKSERDTCKEGWPCYRVLLRKSSLSVCQGNDPDCPAKENSLAICLSYENKTTDTLYCDSRLEIKRSQAGPGTQLLRNEKLSPLQTHKLCYHYAGSKGEFETVQSVGLVCSLKAGKAIEVCDLESSTCRDVINNILTFTR